MYICIYRYICELSYVRCKEEKGLISERQTRKESPKDFHNDQVLWTNGRRLL